MSKINGALNIGPSRLRVLIVGLLDRQFELIAGEFPALELLHQSSQVNASKNESVLMRAADRIICMTKFISHTKYWKLDRAKTVMVNGGMAALREALRHISTHVSIRLPLLSAPPTDDDVKLRAHDFEALRIAMKGQVLTFNRRDHEPPHVFHNAAHAARDLFRREHGIHSILELTSNRAVFTVTDIASNNVLRLPILDAAEALLLEKSERTPPAEMRAILAPMWRRVFRASQWNAPYAPMEHHITTANNAVGGYLAFVN